MSKTILITGCSSGIGKETAKLFAARGWNVVATMRNPAVETELNTLPNVKLLRLDVTEEDSIQTAIKESLNAYGAIDVVVNNAGYGAVGPLEAADYSQYFRQFDTNVFGVIRVIQNLLPHFRERKSGLIINVSSVGEAMGMPFGSLYHSSKWALGGLSESLMYELNPLGIRIKLVMPAPVKTNFFGRSMDVIRRPDLSVYDQPFSRSFYQSEEMGQKYSVPPHNIANMIYKAATDGSNKFRYPVGMARYLLLLRRLVPEKLFFAIARSMFFE